MIKKIKQYLDKRKFIKVSDARFKRLQACHIEVTEVPFLDRDSQIKVARDKITGRFISTKR